MYVMNYTKPDIACLESKLSRFTSNPIMDHCKAIKRVLKYLRNILDYRLYYTGYLIVPEEYSNANWISNTKDLKFTSGYIFILDGATML
jgi:hypothetical protein